VSGGPLRVKVAMALAAALAVAGAVSFCIGERSDQQRRPDVYHIDAQVQRLQGVRELVPSDAKVGFATDVRPTGTAAFLLIGGVRFALAPRFVEPDQSSGWLVGDFSRPVDFSQLAAKYHLQVVRDFGRGLVLFRNEAR